MVATSNNANVAERIRQLQQLEKQLENLRETCRGGQEAQHCGVLNALAELSKTPPRPLAPEGHIQGAHAAGRQRKAARKCRDAERHS
jgi:hypothetical protein